MASEWKHVPFVALFWSSKMCHYWLQNIARKYTCTCIIHHVHLVHVRGKWSTCSQTIYSVTADQHTIDTWSAQGHLQYIHVHVWRTTVTLTHWSRHTWCGCSWCRWEHFRPSRHSSASCSHWQCTDTAASYCIRPMLRRYKRERSLHVTLALTVLKQSLR